MNLDPQLTAEFVCEAKERLASIEDEILQIERGGADADRALIDKVFRDIHSIKGAAGFLALNKINDLAHTMETVLHMIRAGEIKPDRRLADAFLDGVDSLKTMLANVGESEKTDISKIVDRLAGIIAKNVSRKTKTELSSKVRLFAADGSDSGYEADVFRLNNRAPGHEFMYILRYDLNELRKKEGMSPVSLVRELMSAGEILDSKLSSSAESLDGNLSAAPLSYEALYSTVLGPDLIAEAAHAEPNAVITVSAEPPAKKTSQEERHTEEKKSSAPSPATRKTAASAAPSPKPEPAATARDSHPGAKNGGDSAGTIRINLSILDKLMALAGELVLVRNQHLMASAASSDPSARGISQRLDLVTSEIQETIMRARMQPAGNVFSKLPRIVRDLSVKLKKSIDITLSGEDVELDKTILESLADPLTHIIRNACDHGVGTPEERANAGKSETGRIHVSAAHEGGQIVIEISDDGKGMNSAAIKEKALSTGIRSAEEIAAMTEKEIFNLVTLPGFSTSKEVSDVSGRGVGMDVVKTCVDKAGGSLEIDSVPGSGTHIFIRMPLTLAIIPCLIIVSGGNRYAVPQASLEELVCLYDGDAVTKIESDGSREVFRLRDRLLPMVRLDEALASKEPFNDTRRAAIAAKHKNIAAEAGSAEGKTLSFAVVRAAGTRFGLIIDRVIGAEEIVVKPMHPSLKNLGVYSGATIMGDGKCALILDIDGLAAHAGLAGGGARRETADSAAAVKKQRAGEETQDVLLFKSGPREQFAVPLQLIKRIEKINSADIETVGGREFVTIDGDPARVARLERVFDVSECVMAPEMFLLLPKHIRRPFGILISSVTDIEKAPLNLNTSTLVSDGVLGSLMLRGHITVFPDIYRVIEKIEPDWFDERKTAAPPPKEKKRILLAEDAAFFQKLVKGYLEADGYAVETASNGKEAAELFSSGPFDLVVSDIEMPEMSGWDLIKEIRRQGSSVPAVALTALDSPEDKAKSLAAGFNDYQVKIDREALLKCLSEVFSVKTQNAEVIS
jgi:two-component system chemotaxis sensor kinase CheA